MSARTVRILDGYVSREFVRIFAMATIGFPLFTVLINLADNLDKYLGRNVPLPKIALSFLYASVEQVFYVIPAAVLFATVFSIGAFSRHSEVTAAKASGISFQRLAAPVFLLATLAGVLAYFVGDMVPRSKERQAELVGDSQRRSQVSRYNFVYRADGGRTYSIGELNAPNKEMHDLQIEREGTGPEFPGYFLVTRRAVWDSTGWTLHDGTLRLFLGADREVAFVFATARQKALAEAPLDLLQEPKAPDQMSYGELGHYIRTLERSGSDANKLKVERALKIAIPFTCLVIALFGAPLGITGSRSGPAYGVAVSLATTIVFLMAVQITKAVGSGGVVPPMLAAWAPNVIFGGAGAWLFARARS